MGMTHRPRWLTDVGPALPWWRYAIGEYWCPLMCLAITAAFGLAELTGLLPHQPEPAHTPTPAATTTWQGPPPTGLLDPIVPPLAPRMPR